MSKRQELRAKRRRNQQIQTAVTIGLVSIGAILLVLVFIWPSLKSTLFPEEEPTVASWVTPERPNVDRNAMGDPNAPIKVDEYSDFQCPVCGRFSTDIEPLIVENYIKTGKVYFIYRSMGNFISEGMANYLNRPEKTESRDAAMAAYCAADENKFWEMHDGLFTNNLGEDAGSYTEARLIAIARAAGLDVDTFKSCMSSDKYSDQVDQDSNDGTASGVNATPAFLITYTVNGEAKSQLVIGLEPYENFQNLFDAVLAEIGQ